MTAGHDAGVGSVLAANLIGNGEPLADRSCVLATIVTTCAGTVAAAAALGLRGKFMQHTLQQTILNIRARLPAAPLVFGSFSAVTCGLSHYRNEDDIYNYAAGASVAGLMLAGARGGSSGVMGYYMTALPVAMGVAYLINQESKTVTHSSTEKYLQRHGSEYDIYKTTYAEIQEKKKVKQIANDAV